MAAVPQAIDPGVMGWYMGDENLRYPSLVQGLAKAGELRSHAKSPFSDGEEFCLGEFGRGVKGGVVRSPNTDKADLFIDEPRLAVEIEAQFLQVVVDLGPVEIAILGVDIRVVAHDVVENGLDLLSAAEVCQVSGEEDQVRLFYTWNPAGFDPCHVNIAEGYNFHGISLLSQGEGGRRPRP